MSFIGGVCNTIRLSSQLRHILDIISAVLLASRDTCLHLIIHSLLINRWIFLVIAQVSSFSSSLLIKRTASSLSNSTSILRDPFSHAMVSSSRQPHNSACRTEHLPMFLPYPYFHWPRWSLTTPPAVAHPVSTFLAPFKFNLTQFSGGLLHEVTLWRTVGLFICCLISLSLPLRSSISA